MNETRPQAKAPGGIQVPDVGGRHHHFFGFHAQKIDSREIGLLIGLVVFRDFGAEDEVPRQAGVLGHIIQQRDIPVG